MKKLRAVIYCRCSTEEESQTDALKKQVQESIDCVEKKGWYLVGKYIEAKSGTSIKGREEYQRLFVDLVTDRFDVVVIKSQDRLMRNVKDWYLFLDSLVTNGKQLYIYLENKFYSPDDALITGIKAILAEEYSRELSKKINNAHKSRQKKGGKPMLTSRTFGYKKLPDGTVEMVEEEAEIIRQVYDLCIAGYGSRTIANILLNKGYVNRNGNNLSASRILKMIRNPLYTGTMVMNRMHYDFDTKKVIQNPSEEWIYQKGVVPAIIGEDLWKRANMQVDMRSVKFKRNSVYTAWSNPGKYQLSGKMSCSECGQKYYRIFRKGYANPEETIVEWKCCSYINNGRKNINRRDKLRRATKEFQDGCDNIHLNEEIVFSLLEQLCDQYFSMTKQKKQRIIERALSLLKKVLKQNNSVNELRRLEEEEKRLRTQKDLLLSKLLDMVISDADYQKKNGEIEICLKENEIHRGELQQTQLEMKNLEKRMEEIKENLTNGGIEKATVGKMLEDIDQIIVHEWYLEIQFNPLKLMGLSEKNLFKAELFSNNEKEDFIICLDYPFPPNTERGRLLDKIRIVEIMEQTPKTTAKNIAQQMNRPVKIIQNRIADLRKEGYIEFCGAGGHGIWNVLKSSEKMKEQMKK